MFRTLKKILKGEAGQAFPVVLALLVIGGLTIVPSLNLTISGAKSSRMLEANIRGNYAAEAGVEDALWSLANGMSPSSQLPENINDMQVNIQTVDKGTYTVYLSEFIEPGEHSDYLGVSGDITWNPGADAYKYTITVTWQPNPGPPTIHLEEVGARIPVGYTYQAGSAADFTENLSNDEPEATLDGQGAYLLNWELGTPAPYVSEEQPVQTQIFYITGAGNLDDYYTWVVANRSDVGAVGEITGTAYQITATAICPETGDATARIVAEAMIGGGATYITSWQISN